MKSAPVHPATNQIEFTTTPSLAYRGTDKAPSLMIPESSNVDQVVDDQVITSASVDKPDSMTVFPTAGVPKDRSIQLETTSAIKNDVTTKQHIPLPSIVQHDLLNDPSAAGMTTDRLV
ncbi:MAG: hypothetical protein Q9170_007278 [Blastenia crenularia]